jgi:lipopolysaccharide export system permease protein
VNVWHKKCVIKKQFKRNSILMKIRERYIRKTLLSFTLVVLVIWLGVYSFFNLLSEMSSIGQVNYTILEAGRYIALQIPEVAYKHASPVILLGCVLGMGHLATTNQLLVLRVSGMSIFKLTVFTIKTALIFVIAVIAIGEIFAPIASEEAERGRSTALDIAIASQSQEGFWIRDGENFINVQTNIDGETFKDVTIIEVNSSNKISTVVTSEVAEFDGKSLEMDKVEIFSINGSNEIDSISFEEGNPYRQIVSFDEDLIDSLKKEPDELTTWNIIKQIQFLSDNKLRSGIFEVELYKRLIKPITLVAMILLAMLFIFGSTRDATLGRKIFFGISLGLSFELLSRIGGAMALSFDFNPVMSAVLPTIVVMVVAIILLIQKSMS